MARRRDLPGVRALLRGRRRRRHRRSARHHGPAAVREGAGRGRGLAHPLLRLPAGRRRLRRGRLPGVDPLFGVAVRRRRPGARGPPARACGSSSTSSPTTPPTSTPGSARRWPAAPRASATTSAPARARTVNCRPTTGSRSSAAPPGRGSPTATGTCTCSPPSSPTSTGTTPRCAPSSTRCCASGWTSASTASASTSPTAWSRRRACPTSARSEQAKLIGSQVLPFFDQDGVHEIHRSWRELLDCYAGERIARRRGLGPLRPSASPCTYAPTNCTRPSTSSS